MKKICLVGVLVLCFVLLTGCSSESTCNQISGPEVVSIRTSENWTYIELDLKGNVGENTTAIGNAVLQWEEQNPNREIVSVTPIYRSSSYGFYYDEVDGLSIYSQLIQK